MTSPLQFAFFSLVDIVAMQVAEDLPRVTWPYVIVSIRLKKMMSYLDILESLAKTSLPGNVLMVNLKGGAGEPVSSSSSVACPAGKGLVVKPGIDSVLERTVCGKHGPMIRVGGILVRWVWVEVLKLLIQSTLS